MDSKFQDQLDNLKSHLMMIKSLKDSEAEDQYFVLIQKAKQTLGQMSPHIANFYFQYGSFLLGKIQQNMDILNAGAVPEAQANEDIDQIPEVYEDQSQPDHIGATAQKVEKTQKKQEQIVYEDQNVQIIENQSDKIEQKEIQDPNQIQQVNQNTEKVQEQGDIEIAYQHFQVALNIYEKERQKIDFGQDSPLSKQQIDKSVLFIHSRLGDLYMLDQQYIDAIAEYNIVIKLESQKEDRQYNRRISEAHYMIGNCFLHENKQDCQKLAIREYIASIKVLIKHIEVLHHYNVSKFQIPTEHKVVVDRFAYLNHPNDKQTVKEIKQLVQILLDKIEDTQGQIGQRAIYQKQKNKMNQTKQENTFKQVSKDVKVTNLGTFGNRKKSPSGQNVNPNSSSKDTANKLDSWSKSSQKNKIPSEQKPESNKGQDSSIKKTQ